MSGRSYFQDAVGSHVSLLYIHVHVPQIIMWVVSKVDSGIFLQGALDSKLTWESFFFLSLRNLKFCMQRPKNFLGKECSPPPPPLVAYQYQVHLCITTCHENQIHVGLRSGDIKIGKNGCVTAGELWLMGTCLLSSIAIGILKNIFP